MSAAVSPGVERAEARAAELAVGRGCRHAERRRLAPNGLARRRRGEAGGTGRSARRRVAGDPRNACAVGRGPAVASAAELYQIARRQGILSLRSDASVTTDLLLLAAPRNGRPAGGARRHRGVPSRPRWTAATPRLPDVPFAAAEEFHVPEPTELLEAARIVDVNANRARESLRVLDDYARFALNDAVLTAEVKRLRHDLAHAVGELASRG